MKLQLPILHFLLFIVFLFNCQTTVKAQKVADTNRLSTFTIEAPELKISQKIWVYLPQNYSSSTKKFPVIYIYDIENIFGSKTSDTAKSTISKTLDNINANVILIGIEDHNKKYESRNVDAYIAFTANTLKPYVDLNYRTKPNTNNTVTFGNAIGGLIAFQAVLKYPKVFGKAGVFSPTFSENKAIYDLTENTETIKSKIYFLSDEKETMVQDINKMEHLLNIKRCSCLNLTKKTISKGQQDNKKLWQEGFEKAYLWLL